MNVSTIDTVSISPSAHSITPESSRPSSPLTVGRNRWQSLDSPSYPKPLCSVMPPKRPRRQPSNISRVSKENQKTAFSQSLAAPRSRRGDASAPPSRPETSPTGIYRKRGAAPGVERTQSDEAPTSPQ